MDEAASQNSAATSFQLFWPIYLDAHRHPATRFLHYLATSIGIAAVVLTTVFGQPAYLLGIPAGYALAIASHHWFEGRKSLVSVNILYGARADIRMCWLAATGRLFQEYARLGLKPPQRRVGGYRPGWRKGWDSNPR